MDPSTTPPAGTTSPEFQAAVQRGKRSSQALTGLLLIVLGGIFLADRIGDQWGWHAHFGRLWPLLLIVGGLGVMFSHRDSEITIGHTVDGTPEQVRIDRSGRRFGDGFFLILVGVLMLAHMNRWMPLTQSWPLFIVAAGISMMFGRNRTRISRSRGHFHDVQTRRE